MATTFEKFHVVKPHLFLGGQEIPQPVSKACLGENAAATRTGVFFNPVVSGESHLRLARTSVDIEKPLTIHLAQFFRHCLP